LGPILSRGHNRKNKPHSKEHDVLHDQPTRPDRHVCWDGLDDITMSIAMLIKKQGGTMKSSAAKTKRITILGTSDFKDFLIWEAKKEGISLSQLVRELGNIRRDR